MHLQNRSGVPGFLLSAVVVLAAACGATNSDNDAGNGNQGTDSGNQTQDSGNQGGGQDSGMQGTDSGTAPDSGSATDGGNWNEAPHLAPPLEIWNGGRLLYNPKVVTVTFAQQPNAPSYEQFDDAILTSAWWTEVTAGYCDGTNHCIGAPSNGGHIELPFAAASSYTDSADTSETDGGTLKEFIAAQVAGGTFPEPDANTLYVLFIPAASSVTLTDQGQSVQSCIAFGGYHHHVQLNTATGIVDTPYAVVMNCVLLGLQPTVGASHEIMEATTDPILTNAGPTGFYMDQTRDAWLSVSAAEVGDVCALLRDFSQYLYPKAPPPTPDVYVWDSYDAQRLYSNESVQAGHAMCVPTNYPVYFNTAPSVEKLVLQKGQSQTIELTGFSDGPTSDWTVNVVDFTYITTLTQVLTLTLDNTTANNGTTLHLTVDVTGTVSPTNGAPFVIVSSNPTTGDLNFWPGIVETQ
jgi:hypothetical protein